MLALGCKDRPMIQLVQGTAKDESDSISQSSEVED